MNFSAQELLVEVERLLERLEGPESSSRVLQESTETEHRLSEITAYLSKTQSTFDLVFLPKS